MTPEQTGNPIYVVAIDDDAGTLELLASALRREDVVVVCASSGEEGLEHIRAVQPRVVILDLVLPRMGGLEVLDQIMKIDSTIEVIMTTADDTIEHAVEAIRCGASDYLVKPVSIVKLRDRIEKTVDFARRRHRARQLSDQLIENSQFQGMVGNSSAMWELFERVQRVATHFQSVLIQGPTGSGKELVARALHNLSPVAKGNFVALNCSAVVETLFESELFGHVRGAFTGANSDKTGLFEHAHNGTLFLDEVGDMPLATQSKLLRSLQSREVQKLGSLTAKKVNVRVIAATHRDLRAAIAAGQFREDLFYRLAMVEIRVPGLAERDGDLPLLVHWLVKRFAELYGKPIRGCTPRVLSVLSRQPWPGNVRELENVIGHAAIMTASDVIDLCDLPDYILQADKVQEKAAAPEPAPVAQAGALPALHDQEKRLLEEALRQCGNNQSKAARVLRISRDTLRYRIKRYGIE